MLAHGCTYQCIAGAKISIVDLRARGFITPPYFRDIGMDSLDLADVQLTQQMIRLFGAQSVRECFVTTASDVIALAGSRSSTLLNLSVDESLAMCAGDAGAAREYLSQLHDLPKALSETNIMRLLDCGIRSGALAQLGIGLSILVERLSPSPEQLKALGFEVRLK